MMTHDPLEATAGHEPLPLTRVQQLSLRSFLAIEALSRKILWCLEYRSKSSRAVIGCILIVLALSSARHVVHAQTVPGGTHLLQNEIDTAYSLAVQFDLLGNAISLAQYIFGTLAALTVIVNVLSYYIRQQTVKGLGQVVLTSILRLGIPFVIIGIAPTVLPTISLIGLQVAGAIANNPGNGYGNGAFADAPPPATIQDTISTLYNATFGNTYNNGGVTITPSNIATFGENIGFTIIDKASCAVNGGKWVSANSPPCTPATGSTNTGQTYNSNDQVMQTVIVLCIGIIGTFVFIAIELVIAYLQIYLVLPIAAFSLGFLGSPATAQYGSGYWTVVVTALLKFVTVVFTIGFAITLANEWAQTLSGISFNTPTNAPGTTDVGALKVAIGYSMSAFSLLYIVRILPSLFGGLLTGSPGSADGNQAEYQAQNLGGRSGASRQGFVGATGGRNFSPPGGAGVQMSGGGSVPINRPPVG